MRVVIVGAGAIGSLYGGMLAAAGAADVVLVGRAPHVTTIAARGLEIRGVLGNHTVSVDATDEPGEVRSADLVVLTTKAYDAVPAALSVRHLVDGGATVFSLQNGLGIERRVAAALGTRRVLRGTTCMGALVTAPGQVTATGIGLTEVGTIDPQYSETVDSVVKMLHHAGFETRASDNIEGVVWTKTIVNCGLNPVAALTGLSNGEIHADPGLRRVVIGLVNEATAVAHALGVRLTTENPIGYTLGTAKATAQNINSMLRDVLAQKRTEIDSITGEVVAAARRVGVPTPLNETVYALVKAVESSYLRGSGLVPPKRRYAPGELAALLPTT